MSSYQFGVLKALQEIHSGFGNDHQYCVFYMSVLGFQLFRQNMIMWQLRPEKTLGKFC